VRGRLSAAQSPEDRELEGKERELRALEQEFGDLVERIATLTALLAEFESRYQREVGALFVELDELEARLARAAYETSGGDERARAWRAAEEQARETARAGREGVAGAERDVEWVAPTAEAKALFREAAKRLHPDLHEDPVVRERATVAMAAANDAYGTGDLDALRRILRDWEHSPEAVTGDDTAAALVRAIRRAAQLRERIAESEAQLEALSASELNLLRERAEADPGLLDRLRTDLEAGLGGARGERSSSEAGR